MPYIMTFLVVLICLFVGIYTASFGYFVWQKKNYRGAIGVYILAGATVVVPLLIWFSLLQAG